MKEAATTNKCTSVPGHFDSHGGATGQYRWQCPMQHVAAARATANEMTMLHVSTLLTIWMAVAVCRYYTPHLARWRRSQAFINATKHPHWASTCSDSINWTHLPMILWVYFIVKLLTKGSSCPNNNRGMTHQPDGNNLSKTTGYLVGLLATSWPICSQSAATCHTASMRAEPENFVGVVKLALYCYRYGASLCGSKNS